MKKSKERERERERSFHLESRNQNFILEKTINRIKYHETEFHFYTASFDLRYTRTELLSGYVLFFNDFAIFNFQNHISLIIWATRVNYSTFRHDISITHTLSLSLSSSHRLRASLSRTSFSPESITIKLRHTLTKQTKHHRS